MVIDCPKNVVPTGGAAVDAAFSTRRTVRFHASHTDATSLYLLLGQADGTPMMLTHMDPAGRDEWVLSVRLTPGVYRYRYYANDGGITRYVPPEEPGDLPFQMVGLDALFVVPAAPKATGTPTKRMRGN